MLPGVRFEDLTAFLLLFAISINLASPKTVHSTFSPLSSCSIKGISSLFFIMLCVLG